MPVPNLYPRPYPDAPYGVRPPGGYPPVPGWPPHRQPSGLFPSRTSRPTYREPFPATQGAVMSGAGVGALWMLLFALVGRDVRSYCWWSIGAALAGWLAAAALARNGDRGVAAGVAMAVGFGLAVAVSVVVVRWNGGHWVLW
jgi:hypothetical protein